MDIPISILIYKALIVSIGLISIYYGYKLFLKGFYKSGGEVNLQIENYKLLLKKAAPGTLFVLIGGMIIITVNLKGIDTSSQIKTQKPSLETKNYLFIDTTINSIPKKGIKIDSLYELVIENESDQKYLNALKYCYLLKGILLVNDSSGRLYDKVNYKIRRLEGLLQKSTTTSEQVIVTEETRSTKISDSNNDSIR